MTDGVFELWNWPLVFWEIVTLTLAVFLILLAALAVKRFVPGGRGEMGRDEYEQKRRDLQSGSKPTKKRPRTPYKGHAA